MNYLICHKDYKLRLCGSTGGAELATESLARLLKTQSEAVYVAGQLDSPEQEIMGVPYWYWDPSFLALLLITMFLITSGNMDL